MNATIGTKLDVMRLLHLRLCHFRERKIADSIAHTEQNSVLKHALLSQQLELAHRAFFRGWRHSFARRHTLLGRRRKQPR
ncbi:hypothetical protein RI054_11g55590 [Pseudoscourfieldia marina]